MFTGPQTLTLPTTTLTDGTHTLTLAAIDAAGNESVVTSKEVTIDNNPPPPPVGLTATPTQTGSSTFVATWTDPSGDPAPITAATYQVCPASGSGACSTPATAPAAGPATVTVPSPGTWTLAVWLTDAAGNNSAITAADITLSIPMGSTGVGGSSGGGSGGNSTREGGPGGKGSSGGRPSAQATINVSETLHGRELVVRITGPATAKVRVSFTARLAGRIVASRAKVVMLKQGKLTAIFLLSPRTAAQAAIQIRATLGKDAAVTSPLHRHHTHTSCPASHPGCTPGGRK